MNVLTLYGSARRNGSSASIAESFLQSLPKNDRILRCRTAELHIAPCRNCGGCAEGRPCVIRDDFPGMLRDFQCADVLVLAAPIYYYGMPAPLKLCLDRLHAWPPAMEQKPKTIVLLTVSADDALSTSRPLIDQMKLICSYRGWKLETLWIGGINSPRNLTLEHYRQIEAFAHAHIASREDQTTDAP